MANHFNTFFTSAAAKLNEKIVKAKTQFSHYLGQITDETIFLSPTTPADIEYLINCIKPNKTIGPNSIPTKILKEFKTELSEPLRDMINVSFNGSVTKCKIMSEGHSLIQSPTINDYDIV